MTSTRTHKNECLGHPQTCLECLGNLEWVVKTTIYEFRPHDQLKSRFYETMIMFCYLFHFSPAIYEKFRGGKCFCFQVKVWLNWYYPMMISQLMGGDCMVEKKWGEHILPAPSNRGYLEPDVYLDQRSLPLSKWTPQLSPSRVWLTTSVSWGLSVV